MGLRLSCSTSYMRSALSFLPSIRHSAGKSLATAAALGLLFGFMAYMTYDMTNMATLKAWTVKLLAMDIAWGSFVTGLAALVSAWASRAVVP